VAERRRQSNPASLVPLVRITPYSVCTANSRDVTEPVKFKSDMWQHCSFVALVSLVVVTHSPSCSNVTIVSLSGVCGGELQRRDEVQGTEHVFYLT
jgi:hypothetical protein